MILQLGYPIMWKYIIQDIGDTLQHLPLAAGIGLVLYLIWSWLFCSNILTRKHQFEKILFLTYLLVLIQITLLTREPGSRTTMNLHLFGTVGSPRANAYVVENLFLFMPYGVLLPLIWKRARQGLVCILAGAMTSVVIEFTQLLTQRGYFQIDDMVMNTLGMACGYLFYQIINWIRQQIHR